MNKTERTSFLVFIAMTEEQFSKIGDHNQRVLYRNWEEQKRYYRLTQTDPNSHSQDDKNFIRYYRNLFPLDAPEPVFINKEAFHDIGDILSSKQYEKAS